MRPESLDFLTSILNTPSPSGFEHRIAELYRRYMTPIVDRVTTDIHGNVTASINPDANMRIMLAGHMDEIGFIIHYIDDDGYLYFMAVGGHDSAIPVGQKLWVYGRKGRQAGVVGRKAIHLLEKSEQTAKPDIHELWIDIGASSREEAEAVVQLGDVATFQYEFQPLLGNRATARGFDNKAGLYIVSEAMRLLREDGGLHPDVGVFALGTVQEEIGSRGAETSAFSLKAQTGLAIDMEHAIDTPGVTRSRYGQLDMGKGPSVSIGANTNPVVFDLVTEAARREGIPIQVQVSPSSTPTDQNKMQISRGGMATGLLGVPLRYMHTPAEVVDLTDVQNCARLVAAYCRMVTPTTDFTPLATPDRRP